MRTINKEELNKILENHTKWLNNGDGTCAYLSEAGLSGANLCGADLRMANLSKAILVGADLSRGTNLCRAKLSDANLCTANLSTATLTGADLRGADLFKANLRKACLYAANLSEADLRCADLTKANLRSANLTKAILNGADLRDADLRNTILPDPEIMNSICPMNCPEKGGFIGWKKANVALHDENGFKRNVEAIVELQIPARAKRSSATGRKCRCNKAAVLDIQTLDGESLSKGTIAHSKYMHAFTYEVGQKLYVEDFDDNRWNECSTGIHFFITRQEAVDYII